MGDNHQKGVVVVVHFNPLSVEYIEWARLLHNDPEVLSMLTDTHEVSKEEQYSWFEKLENSTTSKRLVAFIDNTPVGVVRLDSIDISNSSVCVGLDIHKDFRGSGFSRPIYKKLFKRLFIEDGFNRIWLLVASFNERAIHIYKSLGFVDEGVMRKALYRNLAFHDYLMLSVLKEEYLK